MGNFFHFDKFVKLMFDEMASTPTIIPMSWEKNSLKELSLEGVMSLVMSRLGSQGGGGGGVRNGP